MGRKETVFKYFNEQKEYTKDRVALGIEKNRKGFAELSIKDQKGNPIENVHPNLPKKLYTTSSLML